MTERLLSKLTEFNNRSTWLFVLVSLVILGFAMLSWQLEIKPRLQNEAISNLQVLADSRAKSIEAQIQLRDQDLERIHDSFNEMLLLTNPISGGAIFSGIELELDPDALPLAGGNNRIQVGDTRCVGCVKTETPLYLRDSGELFGIMRVYANPQMYKLLVIDIRFKLLIVLVAALAVIVLAWIVTNGLLFRLQERESNLSQEVAERKRAEEKLHQIATYDQLTNLPNRYLLHTEFEHKLEEAERHRKKLAVLFFDLDHFKTINDIYGHETGDLLLQEVSERVSGQIRKYDLLSRFGGDEFVMIMPMLDSDSEVYTIVEKIIDSFRAEFDLGNLKVQVTTSIGISVFPDDGKSPSQLLKNADLAMYRAKSAGRNGFHFFTAKMNQELHHSQWIESNLRLALKNNGLSLYLQPQLELATNHINSCEALLRWPQADGRLITPDEFIPIAERSELINQVTEWVLEQAYAQQCVWSKDSVRPVRIDINLSSKDLGNERITQRIFTLIDEDPLFCDRIGIELTENMLLESSKETLQILHRLYQAGMHISIDDFGTGYSSMNYLKQFTVSCIKIDQSFVREAPDNPPDQSIMQAITSVGHGLGMQVIAEGVEDQAHYRLSEKIHCDLVQGYYVSRPIPIEEFCKKYLTNPA